MKKLQRQKGFTLVELAIVMTIIGLLIGGVLKGQALITNARVTAQIAQLQSIQAANTTFQDTYSGLPGDLGTAIQRLPNCSGGASFCFNGAGAGTVGTVSTTGFIAPVAPAGGVGVALGTAPGEPGNFWVHLASANLITGIAPGTLVFGSDLPFAKINNGAGLMVQDIANTAGAAGGTGATTVMSGLYVTTIASIAAPGAGTVGGQAMTPNQAANIDRKMDDGNPTTGVIIGSGQKDCNGTTTANAYTESVTTPDCNISYQLQ